MLPLLRNPPTIPSISIIYSGWSSLVFSSTIYLLYSSRKYLKFGSPEILPLYGVYVFSEFLKWAFINSKFNLYPPYRPKSSSGVFNEVIYALRGLKIKNILKNLLFIVSGVACYYIAAILFGAAITESLQETFMFSVFMSILTVFPLCINLGAESIIELVGGSPPCDEFHWLMYYSVFSAWLGAWLGAFVIPLDWDRPWQVWPIPCNTGAIFSLTIFYISSCIYFSLQRL